MLSCLMFLLLDFIYRINKKGKHRREQKVTATYQTVFNHKSRQSPSILGERLVSPTEFEFYYILFVQIISSFPCDLSLF